MARRGRKPKTKAEKLTDAADRTAPNARVAERQALFAGIGADRPVQYVLDPENGGLRPVDNTSDAIGQMWLLGLLDDHGHDPAELRDKGRFWGMQYARVNKATGAKVGSYERASRGPPSIAMSPADLLYERMDANLWRAVGPKAVQTYERMALLTLVVDPLIGYGETVPWAQGLIDEALLKRGRPRRMMIFPNVQDREYLKATIRALCVLVDGALPQRFERRAA